MGYMFIDEMRRGRGWGAMEGFITEKVEGGDKMRLGIEVWREQSIVAESRLQYFYMLIIAMEFSRVSIYILHACDYN